MKIEAVPSTVPALVQVTMSRAEASALKVLVWRTSQLQLCTDAEIDVRTAYLDVVRTFERGD